jgi:hypothetical protein
VQEADPGISHDWSDGIRLINPVDAGTPQCRLDRQYLRSQPADERASDKKHQRFIATKLKLDGERAEEVQWHRHQNESFWVLASPAQAY